MLSSPGKVGYLRTLTAKHRTLCAQGSPCPVPCAGLLLHQFPFRTLPPHLPDSGHHFAFSSVEMLAWFDHTNPRNISVLSSRATTWWLIRPIPVPWTQNQLVVTSFAHGYIHCGASLFWPGPYIQGGLVWQIPHALLGNRAREIRCLHIRSPHAGRIPESLGFRLQCSPFLVFLAQGICRLISMEDN